MNSLPHRNKVKVTSFLAFRSASSSEDTGIAFDNSDAYRFTIEKLSIKDEVFPESLNTVDNFFRVSVEEGKPKLGPDVREAGKEYKVNLLFKKQELTLRDN